MTLGSKRAVFFDRDGVLNRALVRDGKPYPPKDLREFEIPANAATDLQRLKQLGYVLIVVTNQPDIARGTAGRGSVDEMNGYLREQLPLDDVLVCPHDNADGCDCRKPLPGLLHAGAKRFGVDLGKSFMVGDRWRDVDAGHAAGCKTIFIDYHYQERGPSTEPDSRVSSLHDAVNVILQQTSQEEAS